MVLRVRVVVPSRMETGLGFASGLSSRIGWIRMRVVLALTSYGGSERRISCFARMRQTWISDV